MNNRIMQVRKDAGLSQDDFGSKLGLSRNYIWMIENGKREPSDRTVSDIARIFGVREEWLKTGEGDMYVTYTREEAIAAFIGDLLADEDDDNFKLRLIRVLAGLNEKEWISLERNLRELFADKEKDPLNSGSDAQ